MLEIKVSDIIKNEYINLDLLVKNKCALIIDEEKDIEYITSFRYKKYENIIDELVECKKNINGTYETKKLNKNEYPEWTNKFETVRFENVEVFDQIKEYLNKEV